jgi:hypothetical protein
MKPLSSKMKEAITGAELNSNGDYVLRGVHPRTIQALDDRGLITGYGYAGDLILATFGLKIRSELLNADSEWTVVDTAPVPTGWDKVGTSTEDTPAEDPEWRVPTTELSEGDVINNHGMLLRLENRARYVDTRTRETVITFDGVVTNMPDVTDAFMRRCALEDGTPERPVWRVQGNRLATWHRVSKAVIPPWYDMRTVVEYARDTQVPATEDTPGPVKLGPLDSRPRTNRSPMVATDTRTGGLVNIGDKVTDFRGETGYLTHISRAAVPGKSGKVCVASKPGDTMGAREYYDSVWNLAVSTLRPCGCVLTANQGDCTHP